jgi:hypothetical protein
MSLIPPPEASYPDVDTAFTAIQAHAKRAGYAFLKLDKKPHRVLFSCDRAGKYRSIGKKATVHPSKQRKATSSKKCECLMRVELRQDKVSTYWDLRVLNPAHNHEASVSPIAHPAHRISALTEETHAQIGTLSRAGLAPGRILSALQEADLMASLIPKDIANIVQQKRLLELNGKTPIMWLLEVRINPLNKNPTDSQPFRSLITLTSALNISLNMGPYKGWPLFIPLHFAFGRRTLMSYSLIAHIKPTDSACLYSIYVQYLVLIW